MSADKWELTLPHWKYREPPSGLSIEWERVFMTLIGPISTVCTFRPDYAHRANRELLASWHENLRRTEVGAKAVLPFLHGRSQRTWKVGEAILMSVSPITSALCTTIRFLENPTPTRKGEKATTNSLRADIADKLTRFDWVPLADELAAAVVADCNAQREPTADSPATRADEGTQTPALKVGVPAAETLSFVPGAFIFRGHTEPLGGKPLQVLKAFSQAQGKTLTLEALQKNVWTDSVTGQETIRSAVSDARQALRRAIKSKNLEGPSDPLPLVDRGQGLTAWRLDVP